MADGLLQRPFGLPRPSAEEQARQDAEARRLQAERREERTADRPGIADAIWRMLYPTADVAGRLVGPLADVAIGALEGPPIFGEGTEPPELTARTAGQLAGMVLPFGAMRRGASAVSGPARRRLLTAGEPIRAYHGSPARDIQKFDPAYIGTGEGAQTYGQGFYFTKPEKIGRWYQRNLTEDVFRPSAGVDEWRKRWYPPLEDRVPGWIPSAAGKLENLSLWEIESSSRQNATRFVLQMNQRSGRNRGAGLPRYGSDHANRASELVSRMIREGMAPEDILKNVGFPDDPIYEEIVRAAIEPWRGITPTKGALYEVGIHASPEELLDLGKPLSQQSRQVQGPVHDIFDPLQKPVSEEMALSIDPRDIAERAERWKNQFGIEDPLDRMVSEYFGYEKRPSNLFRSPQDALSTERTGLLSERGVPGAQYRGRSSGARDYVIWDAERLEILKRTLPAIIAALAAGSDSSESPQVRRRVN